MATNLSEDEREQIETLAETGNVDSAVAIAGRLALPPEKIRAVEQLLGGGQADSAPIREKDEEQDGGDTDEEVTAKMVRDHYARLEGLYDELGTIDGDTLAAGVTGRKGWYKSRTSTVAGWDGEGRQTTLARDHDTLLDNLEWVDNRSIHATIQYSEAERYAESWQPYTRGESGREWKDNESPTLDYADIEAYAPFADIDLEDEYKHQRLDDDLDTGPVEAAIGEYIDAFANLAGGREHVYALDSVGGAYVMAAPTCTRPIAEHFADDADARKRVFSELRSRVDEWLGSVREHVNDTVPGVQGVFEPDLLNQKNRNYKAPLAVHKTLDGVVTPLDTEDPTYEFTHLSDADSGLIDDATKWGAGFTDGHDTAVDAIVATLWPEQYADADTWSGALTAWLEAEREAERERERRRERERERREERLEDLDTAVSGRSVTPHIGDVFAAVENVDMETLVRRHAAEWEPTGRRNHFNPGSQLWKDSDSGTTCFVNASRNTFTDVGDRGGTGGPAKFMALKEGEISWPGDCADGRAYWAGVKALREDGFDIPVWTPDTTESESDRMPLWSLRKFALAFDIVDHDDLEERESDDGGTYLGFGNKRDYRRAVLWAEEAGFETGRVDHLN